MGLFSKKSKINYDQLFVEKNKYVNKLRMQAFNESDYVIKESLWNSVILQYQELLEYIDKGANYDRKYIVNLLNDANKELEKVKGVNENV